MLLPKVFPGKFAELTINNPFAAWCQNQNDWPDWAGIWVNGMA